MLKREITRQAATFLVIGSMTTLLNYSIFFLLYTLDLNYVSSAGIGYSCGLVLGYILNKKYTFPSKKDPKKSALVYLLVNIFSMSLILVLLPLFVERLQINALLANLILLVFTTILNFFGSKILAFENKEW
jgi:putative flippase GtrA